MAKQFLLEFSDLESYLKSDFIVGTSNKAAFDFVMSPLEEWVGNIALISGVEGSGKTHLANIWVSKNSLRFEDGSLKLVEDIEKLDKAGGEELFHLINKINNEGGKLLLTSTKTAAEIKEAKGEAFSDDLKSRISSAYNIIIEKPDDEVIKALIIKLFSDRQMTVSIDVVEFLSKRMERDYRKIIESIAVISKQSLEKKRNITIPFVKDIVS